MLTVGERPDEAPRASYRHVRTTDNNTITMMMMMNSLRTAASRAVMTAAVPRQVISSTAWRRTIVSECSPTGTMTMDDCHHDNILRTANWSPLPHDFFPPFAVCPAKRYTTDHEWISFDDSNGLGTMGITDYAQKALGDVVYVELPSIETQVASGGEYSPRNQSCSCFLLKPGQTLSHEN